MSDHQANPTMSPDELRATGESLFGYGWQSRIALHFGVADRTVRRWVAGTAAIPSAIAMNLRDMMSMRPPSSAPADETREMKAFYVMSPHLDALTTQAMRAGWHEAEVVSATLNWAISRGRGGAGIAPMIEVLRGAIKTLQAERDT